MEQGLQIFDENGKEIFNSSTRTFKIIDQFDFTPNTTKTISHPLIGEQDVIHFVTPPIMGGYESIRSSKSGNSYTVAMGMDLKNEYQETTDFKVTVGVY